jgi:hypothetical protein
MWSTTGDETMTWFKADDTLHSHPKARAAGPAAMGLWIMAGTYCAAYGTDGLVPRWFVNQFDHGARLASRLVEAGLWRGTDDGGWQFHDWGHYQPTREEVEQERESNRARQKRFRESRRNARNAVSNGVTNGVTNGTPTRPDPTRPVVNSRNVDPPTSSDARENDESPPREPEFDPKKLLASSGLAQHEVRDYLVDLKAGGVRNTSSLINALYRKGELPARIVEWRTERDLASEAASKPKPGERRVLGGEASEEISERRDRTARAMRDEIPPPELDDDPARSLAWVREFRRAMGDGDDADEARKRASAAVGVGG